MAERHHVSLAPGSPFPGPRIVVCSLLSFALHPGSSFPVRTIDVGRALRVACTRRMPLLPRGNR